MRARASLALLGVVAALALVLWLTDEKPSDVGRVAVPALGGHALDRAVLIRWEQQGLQPIEIRRDPGGPFRLTEPIDDLASVAFLRSLAATYDSAQLADQQQPDTEQNRKKYGLDQPRLVVDVKFEDGALQHLELGGEGWSGRDVYVRREGRIYLGGLALWSSLQVNLDDLRDRAVFRTPGSALTGVVVEERTEAGPRRLRLARHDLDWRLVEPVSALADAQAAHGFVAQLLGLHIDQFPPSVVRFPEGAPDLVVTLEAGAQQETVSLFQDQQGSLFGRLPERKITFACGAAQFNAIFGVAADQLRAKVLLPIGNVHQDLVRIIVEPGEGRGPRLVLGRSSVADPQWTLVEPVHALANPTPVQQLLTALNNLHALAFFDGGAAAPRFGLRQDGLRVGALAADKRAPAFVWLGSDDRQGELDVTYAARADLPDEVASVPRGAVDQIRRPWTDYLALEVLRLDQPVQRLDLQRRDGAARTFRRQAQGWRQDGATALREDVDDIVDEVRDLHGKRAFGARMLQLGEPEWTLKLCRDSGDAFATLSFWERNGALLVQPGSASEVAYELSPTHAKLLRQLWQ